MVSTLAILGASAAILASAAAVTMAAGYHSLDDEGCAARATHSLDGGRLVRVIVRNEGPAEKVRLCVLDDSRLQRYSDVVHLASDSDHVFDVTLPSGTDNASIEINRPGWEFVNPYALLGAGADLRGCRDAEVTIRTRFVHDGSEILGPEVKCIANTAGSQHQMGVINEPNGGDRRGGGLLALAIVAVAVPAALLWYRGPWPVVALFTRLLRPDLLDHDVRASLVEAVSADPGANAQTLARRLALPRSVAVYHLRVLHRERIVSCVRHGGRLHYFPHGRLSPRSMRQAAVLRRANAQPLLDLVRERGLAVTEVASRLKMPASSVSRLVSTLAKEGLVVTQREGRTVLIRAAQNC